MPLPKRYAVAYCATCGAEHMNHPEPKPKRARRRLTFTQPA
jgi:hypothetical protein